MDMLGTESICQKFLFFYFNNFSIVLAILHAELHAYVSQTRICYTQTYVYVPQTRVCYTQSYVYVPQNRICYIQSYVYVPQNPICYAQSSKCSYVKFRKNFEELFHNFGELFSHVRIKFKMQFCNLS